MSLAFTAPVKADMFEFLQEKVWYKFEDQDTLWDAWASANSSDAAASKYSGRAMTFMFSTAFISAWSAAPIAFVKKWSGGCLRDHSSGMGGFCLLETNDTNVEGNTQSPLDIYGSISDFSTVVGDTTNRAVLTYRLTDAEMTALDTQWTNGAIYDSV